MVVYFIGFNVYFPYITIYFVNYLNMDYTITGIIQGVGLLAAAVLTIPAAKLIEKGKTSAVIAAAVICNVIGLVIVTLSQSIGGLLIGVFGAGIGYIVVLQSLTAWIKNLYPEDQRGQFEGIKQIFFVCIPMIIGPSISTFVINRWGIEMEISGTLGMVPTPVLFLVSAGITVLSIIPLQEANRLYKQRKCVK